MGSSSEQPPELPTPQRAEVPVRLEVHASGEAHVNQAGRDLHLHYQDGVRRARRVEPDEQAGECPYPGLASFGREQARWFFGRDELTSELIARLDQRLRAGGVQVVVAPSGPGSPRCCMPACYPSWRTVPCQGRADGRGWCSLPPRSRWVRWPPRSLHSLALIRRP